MFFADELWRVPVYLQDVAAHDVGGADFSLTASLVGAVAFGTVGLGLLRRRRWAPAAGAMLMAVNAFFLLAAVDSDPHRLAATFAIALALAGLVSLLPRIRPTRNG